MCNNCNGGFPGLLNLLFGRSSNCGCGCNGARSGNGCGCYDAYYAAQYALNGCGCNNSPCNSCGAAAAFANNGSYGVMATSSNCGCNGGCNCGSGNY